MTPEVEFWCTPNFLTIFSAQLELQPSKAAKKAPKTTQVYSIETNYAGSVSGWVRFGAPMSS